MNEIPWARAFKGKTPTKLNGILKYRLHPNVSMKTGNGLENRVKDFLP
jgi:hypothetical protein